MKLDPIPIVAPELPLSFCSVQEHCKFLLETRRLSFWWYRFPSKVFGNYSLPFLDRFDNWWYQAKPGFCWPVETYKLIEPNRVSIPLTKSFLGYQHLVGDKSKATSQLVINTNFNLKSYGYQILKKERRKNIRKGLKNCELTMVTKLTEEILDDSHAAWTNLTNRTGWLHPVSKQFMAETWRMILDCPGSSIIIARQRSSGRIAGFFITKIIGDTACGDTIAVRNDMLHTRANDALRYTFLVNAARISGVTNACCSVRSNDENLESFKTSLGYKPVSFPARLVLRWGMGFALSLLYRDHYNRIVGHHD